MMPSYKLERANKDLKSIVSRFGDSFSTMCETSRNAYMRTLAPGAQIPREGILYGQDARDEFESMCAGYRAEADIILNDLASELKKKTTDAPDTDAVNTISLLKMRGDIAPDEVSDLLDRYGENPQAYRAIVAIANEKGLKEFELAKHPVDEALQNVADLSTTLRRTLSESSASAGHASEGFLDMVSAQIDLAIPTASE